MSLCTCTSTANETKCSDSFPTICILTFMVNLTEFLNHPIMNLLSPLLIVIRSLCSEPYPCSHLCYTGFDDSIAALYSMSAYNLHYYGKAQDSAACKGQDHMMVKGSRPIPVIQRNATPRYPLCAPSVVLVVLSGYMYKEIVSQNGSVGEWLSHLGAGG